MSGLGFCEMVEDEAQGNTCCIGWSSENQTLLFPSDEWKIRSQRKRVKMRHFRKYTGRNETQSSYNVIMLSSMSLYYFVGRWSIMTRRMYVVFCPLSLNSLCTLLQASLFTLKNDCTTKIIFLHKAFDVKIKYWYVYWSANSCSMTRPEYIYTIPCKTQNPSKLWNLKTPING